MIRCPVCKQLVEPQITKERTPKPGKGRSAAKITTTIYSCPVCGEVIKTESKGG